MVCEEPRRVSTRHAPMCRAYGFICGRVKVCAEQVMEGNEMKRQKIRVVNTATDGER